MDEELLRRVALAQRDYWASLAARDQDYLGSQADPEDYGKGPNFEKFVARDWASFWNQYVEHSKSW